MEEGCRKNETAMSPEKTVDKNSSDEGGGGRGQE